MTVEVSNPDGLPTPESYAQVAIASGTRLVFVAGQMAEDPDGNLLGRGNLATQAHHAFANLACALAGAGARPRTSPESRSTS